MPGGRAIEVMIACGSAASLICINGRKQRARHAGAHRVFYATVDLHQGTGRSGAHSRFMCGGIRRRVSMESEQ
ncbi:hypothetical protein WL18_07965 [Burkholderia ubonensis]|nr:hypothetical protein WL18_07965 [Burkholderia ubonensis]